MDISSKGETLAFVTCNHVDKIRYTVHDCKVTYPNLTYNEACSRLFEILNMKLHIGAPISCMGTIKYKTPHDIRRQVMRSIILVRDRVRCSKGPSKRHTAWSPFAGPLVSCESCQSPWRVVGGVVSARKSGTNTVTWPSRSRRSKQTRNTLA
jgi:hypothetical protein